jgi:seryl-tRNA synthetase
MSEQIEKWKALVKKGQELRSKEQGKFETLQKRLKDDYDHDTVEDLDKEIAEVTAELAEKKAELARLTQEFENEFLDRLKIAAQ